MDARVAQYEFHSVEEVESKIVQFPGGTKFVLQTLGRDASRGEQTLADLRAFLTTHGMVVVAERDRIDAEKSGSAALDGHR